MNACILSGVNTTDEDIQTLKRLAESRFDKANHVIQVTHLSIISVLDRIRMGGYKRVYMQSTIHLGRVASEMIALTVCLDDLGIGIVGQDGHLITDDLLMHSLEREIFMQYQNSQPKENDSKI